MMLTIKQQSEYMGNCSYCGKFDELRPYGKNKEEICFNCSQLPENKDETLRNFYARLDRDRNNQITNN